MRRLRGCWTKVREMSTTNFEYYNRCKAAYESFIDLIF